MLIIAEKYVKKLETATCYKDLYPIVQGAIELEHATIPPYLTALFSIRPGTSLEIVSLLKSVLHEEMLHMCIMCNIMNAIGGKPEINGPGFIPEYPGGLPMNIDSGLEVNLAALTDAQVRDVFMEIEEPEKPIIFQVKKDGTLQPAKPVKKHDGEHKTIGDFYQALKKRICAIEAPLPINIDRQVTLDSFYPAAELFYIETKVNAADAIDIIISQGEGSTQCPIDTDGDLSHYYKFEQIYQGAKLEPCSAAANSFAFVPNSEMQIDDKYNIFNIYPNTKVEMLPKGTQVRRNAEQFRFAYSKLLNGLHRTFNGEPAFFKNSLGSMYDLKMIASRLAKTPFPGKDGYTVGFPFEYVNTNEVVENKASFVEIISDDPVDLFQTFYQKLFDWQPGTGDDAFTPVSTDGGNTFSLGFAKESTEPGFAKATNFYVDVSCVETTLMNAIKLGASEVMKVTEFPLGEQKVKIAMFEDPQKNVIGIIQYL